MTLAHLIFVFCLVIYKVEAEIHWWKCLRELHPFPLIPAWLGAAVLLLNRSTLEHSSIVQSKETGTEDVHKALWHCRPIILCFPIIFIFIFLAVGNWLAPGMAVSQDSAPCLFLSEGSVLSPLCCSPYAFGFSWGRVYPRPGSVNISILASLVYLREMSQSEVHLRVT